MPGDQCTGCELITARNDGSMLLMVYDEVRIYSYRSPQFTLPGSGTGVLLTRPEDLQNQEESPHSYR